MPENITIPPRVRFVMTMAWLFKHWLVIWLILFTTFNVLPILAPISMKLSLEPVGNGIYDLYHLISHQFANRSYFLFGEKLMYSPAELPVNLVGDFSQDGTTLAAFRGDDLLGWKLAWSDRLFAMFGAALITAYFYAVLHKREGFRSLSTGMMLILIAPLWIDGISHYISDFQSLTAGFRYDNAWLAFITGDIFPPNFYIGDDLGSFNSLLRIITGILLGIGFMAWGLGRADLYFERSYGILKGRIDNWWARQKLDEKIKS